ncbi:hypothetical protein P0D73_15600 [Paraburkholderia sp. RL18-101-BIB-B]|uniref:hypothetical protein n=1 Tax=Paraburkholderia sp. RL18-101-BIB-B TaxID=3031634 RepID=UPI0038B860F4
MESDSTIFESLGACRLHAMVAIDRVQAECGAKRVTVRIPLDDGRVVYAAFLLATTMPQRCAGSFAISRHLGRERLVDSRIWW